LPESDMAYSFFYVAYIIVISIAQSIDVKIDILVDGITIYNDINSLWCGRPF